MNRCPSCGGVIGRECFNPVECAQITESQNQQHDQDHYRNGYDEGYKAGYSLAEQRIYELEAWKESAMKVMNDIDLQECAKVLGVPLGQSIADKILPGLKELKARTKELEELLLEIDKSLYIGADLDDTEILKWYIDVVSVIKDQIKRIRPTPHPTNKITRPCPVRQGRNEYGKEHNVNSILYNQYDGFLSINGSARHNH